MRHLYKNISISALIIAGGLLTAPKLMAEDNGPLVVELISRVGSVEAENRELRGLLDENRHEITQLKQRIETLSADVDYRMTNPDSGSAPLPANSQPLPLGKTVSIDAPLSSNSTGDYEKARALLEQGDYEAAEKAFAGFVSSHPKDEQAGAAQYWLGVTFFVRGQHEKAAKAFAKGYKSYPKSSKASDNLLKLAKSLAALDRTADACATLDQLSSEYPTANVSDITYEKRNLGCK